MPNPVGWVDPLGLSGKEVDSVCPDPGKAKPVVDSGSSNESVIYVDQKGLAIEAQKGSVFRANAVTPEIDQSITENGFLSGKARGVVQTKGAALPSTSPIDDRVVQYVEGSPFPRDADFVGFKQVPHDALNTAIRTGRQTLKDPNAFVRLDEVNVSDMNPIDVQELYSETLGRAPRAPLDVVGESVVEGSVPASKIVKTTRLSQDDIEAIKNLGKGKE